MIAIIAIVIILILIVVAVALHDECPRVILGYNCKGKTCNHSSEELYKAKKAMGYFND